ncbi:MAG: hypothetical protein K9J76_07340 [Polaromonas sp.]|nr:hypothetical protein [Polaromonas sp.]
MDDSPLPASPRSARRWPAMLAMAVGALLIAFFGLRAWNQLQFEARVDRGEVQVETLRGWMTLPYIARTYGVPESELRRILGAPATGDGQRSLRDWIDATGRDPATVRRAIEARILARRATASQPVP